MPKTQNSLPQVAQGKTAATLADVRDAVASSSVLSQTRIRDLLSAISSFCSLIDRGPSEVALHPEAIARTLNTVNPAAAGISQKRLANIRSDLRAAIAASGLKPPRPSRHPLTTPWQELWAGLPTKRQRIGLSRLFHYASDEGVVPGAVDDAVIAAFMTDVRDHALHRKPNDLHRQTAVIWNEVVAAHPDLRLAPVTVPFYRAAPTRIDWALLPTSFRDDVDAYLAWCACSDPFAAEARAKPLAPSTVKLRRNELHAAVTALIESGTAPSDVTSLADLVTPENFRSIAKGRLDMADGQENAFNKGLTKTLVRMAREWVKIDEDTLTELKRLARAVPEPPGDLTQKNKKFLRQFDDPAAMERLRALPQKLWAQARRDTAPNFRNLAIAQVALALEILFYMPLRMRNLSALAFDKHLFLHDGRGAVSSLEIPAGETKTKQPIAFDIPPHLAKMLVEYRDGIASVIIGRKPTCVFVNQDGTPKLPQTLSKLIRRTAFKETGIELSPHQFRHLAAKILLDNSPGAFELVKQLLGHQNLKTTANFYAGIDTRRAARHHAELLQKWSEQQERSLPRRNTRRGRKPTDISNRKSKS